MTGVWRDANAAPIYKEMGIKVTGLSDMHIVCKKMQRIIIVENYATGHIAECRVINIYS